jgi:hypothetical protein
MHRTAHFKTAQPEEWTFDANENPSVPGGEALARKLRAGAERAAQAVTTVSQHSYYGWRFEAAFDNVTFECVLNAAGAECFFTIATASILRSWLRPRRTRRALAACEGLFDAQLRQLPEISGVTWS